MAKGYRIIPLILWSIVIFTFSSRGAVQVTEERELDILVHKLAHIAEYCIEYVLCVYALTSLPLKKPQRLLTALLFVGLYGLSDELHQLYTPTRGPKISDVFVDLCGGVVGYTLIRITQFMQGLRAAHKGPIR
jgi:VanZ family protein